MKKLKQILSVVLVLILTLALAVPAFAAKQAADGSITLNNAVEGETYKAYRLFDLSFDEQGGHYGYTVNAEWKEFFTTGEGQSFVHIDAENGNVKLASETAESLQKLAQAAKAYTKANKVTSYDPTGTAPTLRFTNLPLGYYLVSTDAGALQALDTTNKDAVMYEKNTQPNIGKTANKTHAAYGEIVHFTIPVTKGGYVWGDYIIKDTMTGLELKPETVKLTVNDTPLTAETEYTVVSTANSLTVTIPETTLNQRNDGNTDFVYPAGTKFVLEYDAVAKTTVSMENKVTMEYKTNPEVTTPDGKLPEQIVKVANYEFTVKKTDENNTALDGATFELHKAADCSDAAIEFIKTGNTYRLAEVGETATEGAERTATITAGEAKIEGLAAGTYYLKEMDAPAGYNKLVNPVEVKIAENLNTDKNSAYYNQAFDNNGNRMAPTITMDGKVVSSTNSDFILNIVNKTGAELPSTGGIGTIIFYVVGVLLMTVAVVALIIKTKKRRAQ